MVFISKERDMVDILAECDFMNPCNFMVWYSLLRDRCTILQLLNEYRDTFTGNNYRRRAECYEWAVVKIMFSAMNMQL